ncbi:MAG: hypothetical protein M1827_007332 [Pycnora praestabilis]|nr:MAG: hypothetical protein M1827_007332 [Pycnora praestabilis]
MHVLITGAGGFIGQALAQALISDERYTQITLTDIVEPSAPTLGDSTGNVQVRCIKADLSSPSACTSLFTGDIDVHYLLHGIMSGAAESNLERGLQINFDVTRRILDLLRAANKPSIKVIFPSSLAVYGSPSPSSNITSESTAPRPGSSYGAQKLMCETLLNDLSRRGLLDGRVLRLPTVVVRPGKPSGAASSFASGIIREPLRGEKSVLPVSRELKMWVCSPRTVVRNLLLAAEIPKERFEEHGARTVNLPGITVTVAEMLEALRVVGGEELLKHVEERRDPAVDNIVGNWPARFDTSLAKSLGFLDDGTLVETINAYVEDYGK